MTFTTLEHFQYFLLQIKLIWIFQEVHTNNIKWQRKVYFQTPRCTLPAKNNILSTRCSFYVSVHRSRYLSSTFIILLDPILYFATDNRFSLMLSIILLHRNASASFFFLPCQPFSPDKPVLHLCKTTQNHKHVCTILLCFIQENEIFLICVIFITVKAVNYY